GLGSVSVGALIAACSDDEERPSATGEGRVADMDAGRTCSLTAEQTEGPFYFDVDRIRGDITEDREGTRLRVALRVRDAESCEPIENAVVDIWHCDATGLYSGFESASTGAGPGGGGGGRTDDETYLRGAQATNEDGIVQFRTIYPGWYRGRTVHIHAKVHLDRRTVLTSQLSFADDVTERVYAREPYRGVGRRDTLNADDGIYREELELTLRDEGGDGVLGLITFDVDRA
ncbi:MAG TPA: intradiol ring-cleavage dioxygenase, partial [Solirubrobacteraceae bacterium]